ncbi:reverse transcriptase [Tanacetum coccineum]
MESLHIPFSRVMQAGIFTGVSICDSLKLSRLFFADDAVFIRYWNDSNLSTIVHVLKCFFLASGLKINMYKSKLMGIGVGTRVVERATNVVGCSTLSTPFTYLGVKVGDCMSRTQQWDDVIRKISSRLCIQAFHGIRELLEYYKRNMSRKSLLIDIITEVDILKCKGIDLMSFCIKKVGNDIELFWEDVWMGGLYFKCQFSRLYALETCKHIFIKMKLSFDFVASSFHRIPRRRIGLEQYEELFVGGLRTTRTIWRHWCINKPWLLSLSTRRYDLSYGKRYDLSYKKRYDLSYKQLADCFKLDMGAVAIKELCYRDQCGWMFPSLRKALKIALGHPNMKTHKGRSQNCCSLVRWKSINGKGIVGVKTIVAWGRVCTGSDYRGSFEGQTAPATGTITKPATSVGTQKPAVPRLGGPSTPVSTAKSSLLPKPTGTSKPLAIKWISLAERQERINKGLCFNCDNRWTRGHKCPGKFLLLMTEEEDDMGVATGDGGEDVGKISKGDVHVLIDNGSTHNFIRLDVVEKMCLPIKSTKAFKVYIGSEESLLCESVCSSVTLHMQRVVTEVDLYVLPIQGPDVVLGIQWLQNLGKVTHDYAHQTMEFTLLDTTYSLKGDDSLRIKKISLHQMQAMLEHDDVYWVYEVPTTLPPRRSIDHRILLLPETKPVNVRPYRYLRYQKEEMEKLVNEMLSQGIIHFSQSPFSSLILLVKKKDGSYHFCVDYRALNAVTVKDKFPIPTADEMFGELGGAIIFTKLDLRAGDHEPFICTIFAQEHQFYVKKTKCVFEAKTLEHLGHMISGCGVEMDPKKVIAMHDWTEPMTQHQVRGFLGLAGYYRHFIKGYATMAAPLMELLRKDGFRWGGQEATAFQELQQQLSTAHILSLPDFMQEFVVKADASDYGIGAYKPMVANQLANALLHLYEDGEMVKAKFMDISQPIVGLLGNLKSENETLEELQA